MTSGVCTARGVKNCGNGSGVKKWRWGGRKVECGERSLSAWSTFCCLCAVSNASYLWVYDIRTSLVEILFPDRMAAGGCAQVSLFTAKTRCGSWTEESQLFHFVFSQIIAFDELKTDYKNPIDQCNTLNPVSSTLNAFSNK